MVYKIATQAFLGLALLGALGWIYARFNGPLMRVSHDGFHLLTTTALMFAIAITLFEIAFGAKTK